MYTQILKNAGVEVLGEPACVCKGGNARWHFWAQNEAALCCAALTRQGQLPRWGCYLAAGLLRSWHTIITTNADTV